MYTPPDNVPSISDLVSETNKVVAGLEKQKNWLAGAIHRHMVAALNNRPYRMQNILLIGPTGGGKTWLIRNLLAASGAPFVEINATMYSETGYAGLDLSSFPAGWFQPPWLERGEKRNQLIPHLERWGIVVIDEFDKLRFRKDPSGRDTGRHLQSELLRITEGDTVFARSRDSEMGSAFNTHHILFIAVGAFEGLGKIVNATSSDPYEYTKANARHIQNYGFMEELIGRFSTIVALPPLKSEHMYRILTEHIWPHWLQMAEDDGFTLTYEDNALRLIANVSVEERIGARGLEPLVERSLRDAWAAVKPGGTVHLDTTAVAAGARVLEAENALSV